VLQKPQPYWSDGAPIDDPDRAARYLLGRFERLETRFLDGIDGQFALALCDPAGDRLVLACDPGGHRSLFYRLDAGSIAFSSNLATMPVLSPGTVIDRSLEDFLLGYEFLPWDRTPFRGVLRLKKGSVMSFAQGRASLSAIASRAAPGERTTVGDLPSVMRRLHDVFMNSLGNLLPGDEPVALLLGGFDSALIAACLARLGRRFETFTFRFEQAGYTQRHADTLQRLLGHRHNWVDMTPAVIADGLARYELCFNQPVGQMHYLIETEHACAAIRARGFRHCLTGDGCDEVFLGYPTVHQRAMLFRRLGRLPKPLRDVASLALRPAFVEAQLGHVARLGRNVIENLGREMPVRGHITARIFDATSLGRLRRGNDPPQEKPVEAILAELAAGLGELSALRLAYHGKAAVGLNKAKVEGCSAATGLTLQSPYQHPALAAFARSLPDELMRPKEDTRAKATGKHILMRMAEEYELLPAEIIYQTKASPVTAPVDAWYTAELKTDLLLAIDRLPFEHDRRYVETMLRPKFAEELFRRHVGLGRYTSHAISLLATYAALLRHAAPGPPASPA
jgi:asparagine synthase (glutamine-hydrolysing)